MLVFINRPAAKVSEDKILNKCPFELSDNAEWRFYPPDNLAGLVALAQDHDDTDQTFVLVFNHSPKQKYADTVILKGDLVCTCFYDHYDFDNQEIVEKGGRSINDLWSKRNQIQYYSRHSLYLPIPPTTATDSSSSSKISSTLMPTASLSSSVMT